MDFNKVDPMLLGIMPLILYGPQPYQYPMGLPQQQMPWQCQNTNAMIQQTCCQNVSTTIDQLNAKITDLQMQTVMANALQVQWTWPMPKVAEPRKASIYELDKVLFPNDPIRDYIEERLKAIDAKYESIISAIEKLRRC